MTLDRDPLRIIAAEALKASARSPAEALAVIFTYSWEQLCLRRTSGQMTDLLHNLDCIDLIAPMVAALQDEKAQAQ
jgi:hypothetical protein